MWIYKCSYPYYIVHLQAFEPKKYRISVQSGLSRHSSHSFQVQTLPCLPPVMSSHLDKKEFSFPTLADIKHSQKLQDAVVVEHSSSNPTCRCAMCMLHESATASVIEAGLQQVCSRENNCPVTECMRITGCTLVSLNAHSTIR